MKKAIKILGILIGLMVLGALTFAVYVNYKGIPSYDVHPPAAYDIYTDSASIAEGARMASMMCINCHGDKNRTLGGAYMADAKDFGEIYAPNISSHSSSKLSAYSNEELVYLLRTGIKRDGQYSPPYMPKFPNLSDEDMKRLIGFLRSDHPMMAATDHEVPVSQPSFLNKFLCNFILGPLPYPENVIPHVDTTDMIALGRYISTAKFDCYQCHSQNFKTVDPVNPEKTPGFFTGGNRLFRKNGDLVLSSNLTMDDATGLGRWTENDFVRTVKTGLRPNGLPACEYPMVPFAQMTDKEARAIWAYLNTLEPVENKDLLTTATN